MNLIKRMTQKGVPASWISEVKKMQRTIKSLQDDKTHYLGVIDALATENRELRELFVYFFGENYQELGEDNE